MKNKSTISIVVISAILFAVFMLYTMMQKDAFNSNDFINANYSSETDLTVHFLDEISTMGFASSVEDSILRKKLNLTVEEFQEREEKRKKHLIGSLESFRSSDWEKSKAQLDEYMEVYSEPESDFDVAGFYYAKTCLNTGDNVEADRYYTKVIKNGQLADQAMELAEWDRVIATLNGDVEKTKEYLNNLLKNKSHKYYSSASGLMNKLMYNR